MRNLLFVLAFSLPLGAQNPVPSHPRLILNDRIADTWEPAKSRLAAIQQRVLGGNAAATADFTQLRSYLSTSGTPPLSNSSSTDANLNLLLGNAFAYAVYHKAGNDATANLYAAAAWNYFNANFKPATYITGPIVVSGHVATATVPSTANLSSGGAAVWGVLNDLLCGATGITIVNAATFTYSTGLADGSYPITSGATLVTQSGAWAGYNDQYNDSGVALSQVSYFYDWCYDWLVANGHDQFLRDQIKAGYWQETLTRQSSQFSQAIRESDFHNYASWSETSIMEAGLAIYGDDPFGATILAEGAGYLISGVSGIQPAAVAPDTFTYNLRLSKDVLTGGAMNWEGPTYWRAGTIRFLRALEAYDSATGRANNVFGAGGPYANAVNGAWYKLYLKQPDGTMANFGDGGNSNSFSGRDNMGMAILNDRFPDPHFLYFMNHMVGDPWNSGESGEFALVYKAIFFPYVNASPEHDLSDLPLGRQFGPDIVMRSGWSATDTFIGYTSSLHGTYHRHDDGGTFTMFSQAPLIQGQPYTLADPAYTNYNRRTIGGNTLTITDPNDCWKDNSSTCGVDVWNNLLGNDGGQLISFRRLYNEFNSAQFQISRIWSASLYTDNRICNGSTGETCATLYGKYDPVDQPSFAAGAGYEHLRNDLTPSYVNSYSGTGDNPSVKVASTNGVVREMVHFQKTQGSLNPLVIFDRVNAANAGFVKSASFHTINAPSVNGAVVSPGDTTIAGGSVTSFDNGTGRAFISHLLPLNPNVRAVGGNACAPITIQGATNANPAVFYAPAHGLQVGESVGIATGAQPDNGAGPQWWPTWLLDRVFAYHAIASVPDADHFTLTGGYGSDSSGYVPWTTQFAQGNGIPVAGVPDGYMYYQLDAAAGQHVWIRGYGAWQHLTGMTFADAIITSGPVIYSHSICNWGFYVDHMGPAATVNTPLQLHLWNGSMDLSALNTVPNWRIAVQPSTPQTQDYFLNVVNATTTGVSTPPAATLISSNGVYGAQIADANGFYIAVFPASPQAQTSVTYSATHSGTARHVVTGLAASGAYVVTQGVAVLANVPADSSGAVTFTETGGGSFQVYLPLAITSPASLPAVRIGLPFQAGMAGVGGAGAYVWTISAGSLPPGITLSSDGVLAGTPTSAGMYSFTVKLTDGVGGSATQPLSLQIQPVPAGERSGRQIRPGLIIHH